jgi:ribosomal protein S27AE
MIKASYVRKYPRYMSQTPSPKLCPHKECPNCTAQSVSPEVSDEYICCKCYDLHRRKPLDGIAVLPDVDRRD